MKMILKNNEAIKRKINFKKINIKKYINNKNFIIFLLSFLILSIIIGILFYLYMNNDDKTYINNNITSYFTIKKSYDYLNLLKNSIINNIGNTTIIWLLGISIIGIPIIVFLFFSEAFSIGFSLSAIIGKYKLKGFIGIISYLFPSKILYILTLFLITYFALRFSIQIIRYLFFKKDLDLRSYFKKYFKQLIIITILAITCSILDVFITPFMIKLFTFFIK